MNPYLRIKQPDRPSWPLYIYYVLEGREPERFPTVSVEILNELPLGEDPNANNRATAVMGIFFDQELVAQVEAYSWIVIDRYTFKYTNWSHPFQATGIPESKFMSGWVILSSAVEHRVASLPGDAKLAREIQEELIRTYNNWKRVAPADLQPATEAFVGAIRRATSIATSAAPPPILPISPPIFMDCPERQLMRPFVVYAMWPRVATNALPLYFVGATRGPEPPVVRSQIYFEPKAAVEATSSYCGMDVMDVVAVTKNTTELEKDVAATIALLKGRGGL